MESLPSFFCIFLLLSTTTVYCVCHLQPPEGCSCLWCFDTRTFAGTKKKMHKNWTQKKLPALVCWRRGRNWKMFIRLAEFAAHLGKSSGNKSIILGCFFIRPFFSYAKMCNKAKLSVWLRSDKSSFEVSSFFSKEEGGGLREFWAKGLLRRVWCIHRDIRGVLFVDGSYRATP